MSERRFSVVLDSAPVGITEIALDGRIIDANPMVCELMGYSRAELVGMDSQILVAPASRRGRGAVIRGLLEGREKRATYDVRFIRKDGVERDGEVVMTVLRDPQGEPQSMIGLLQDVTDRRLLERRVQSQADLINHTHDAMFVKNVSDSIITFWNSAAERLYGYTAAEAVGRNSTDLLRTVYPGSAEEAEATLTETGEWSGQLMHLTRSGEPVWVESRWGCIKDAGGKPIATLEVNRDITSLAHLASERDELLQVLERQNQELRETDRLKTEFLLTISHELRTPLTAILGFTDLLVADSDISERDELEIIRRNGRRLLIIIEDILTLAQAQAGRLKLRLQPVNLASVVRRAVEKARPEALARGLDLAMGGTEEAVWATADEVAASHVVRHLLDNAIKFTSAGWVRVVVTPGPDVVRIAVSDTGIGVPEDARRLIFEEFRQADQSMTRRHGGVGIGLTVVNRLVDLQGGTLGHEDRAGGGSTFWFSLPAASAPG